MQRSLKLQTYTHRLNKINMREIYIRTELHDALKIACLWNFRFVLFDSWNFRLNSSTRRAGMHHLLRGASFMISFIVFRRNVG